MTIDNLNEKVLNSKFAIKIGKELSESQLICKIVNIYTTIRLKIINSKIAEKCHINGTTLFCFCFAIAYLYYILNTTLVYLWDIYSIIPMLSSLINICIYVLYFKIIIFDSYNKKDLLTVILPEIICWILVSIASNISGYSDLLIYFIFIISARNVDFRKVALISMIIGSITVVSVTTISIIDIIPDLVYGSRHSFGFIYPTDYVAHIFFLILTYFWYRKGKLHWYENAVILAIAAITYYFCHTRLDSGCIILLVIFGVLYNCKYGTRIYHKLRYILIYSTPIAAVATILLSIIYNPNYNILVFIDKIFSHRFSLGHMMMFRHGVTFWGHEVLDVGLGGSLEKPQEYTYIDISYVRILIKYGILILLLLVAFTTLFLKKSVEKRDYVTAIVFLLITINCMVAQHLIDFSYNIFLFILYAKIDSYEQNKVQEVTPKKKKFELHNK